MRSRARDHEAEALAQTRANDFSVAYGLYSLKLPYRVTVILDVTEVSSRSYMIYLIIIVANIQDLSAKDGESVNNLTLY